MYSVYSVIDGEEVCIYDDWSDAESLRLIDPELNLSRNSAGSFTFTLPPTNVAYGTYTLTTSVITGFEPAPNSNNQNDSSSAPVIPVVREQIREVDLMERMVSKIIIYRDENTTPYASRIKKKFWEGRVISEKKDWFNCRMVTCEGDLAYLNDTLQKPVKFVEGSSQFPAGSGPLTILQYIITVHNSKVDSSKTFNVSTASTITDTRENASSDPFEIGYISTMQALQELLKVYGGIIRIQYVQVGYGDNISWQRNLVWDNKNNVPRRPDAPPPQSIDFGKNLLDFSCSWDLSKLCTVIIPTGAKKENTGKDEPGDSIPMLYGEPSTGQYLYLGDGELGAKGIVYTQTTGDTGGYDISEYKTAVFNVDADEDPVIYITCRLTDGLPAYCTCSLEDFSCDEEWGDTQIGYAIAKPGSGNTFQDFVDYKVELPAGTKSIALCSYGNDLKMGCKKQKKGTTTTVTEYPIHLTRTNNGKKIVFATHEENEQIVTDDYAVLSSDNGYTLKAFDLLSTDGITADDIAAGKVDVFMSTRTEVGNLLYCIVNGDTDCCPSGSNDIVLPDQAHKGNQLSHPQATGSNVRFKELTNEKVTVPAGSKWIVIAHYNGSTASSLPKITWKRSETSEINSDQPSDMYVTIEEADTISGWHEKGSGYVINKSLIEKYGWIERAVSFENISDSNLLCTSAINYLKNVAFDEMSINISAIDMRALGAINVDYLNIEDQVNAKSEIHGLDKSFPVTELDIPLNKPESMKVTLGETQEETITDSTNRMNDDLTSSISYQADNALQLAKEHATSLIGGGGNGYVSLIEDDSGSYIKEIVISDTPDPHNAHNLWIFNQNGLGHVYDSNGHAYPISQSGSTVNVAMTMDGQVVADRITTGTLRSILTLGTKGAYGIINDQSGTVDKEGSLIFSYTGDASSYSNLKKALEIKDGEIDFMNHTGIVLSATDYSVTNKDVFAYISGRTELVDDNDNISPLLSISAKHIAFNLGELWINANYQGGDPAPGFTDSTAYYVIDSSKSVLDDDSQAFYLPTTNNPQSSSDYQQVYVRNGVVTTTSADPTKSVKFKRGFTIDGIYS